MDAREKLMPVDCVQEQVRRDANGRFRKGQSGNPKGRRTGVRNKATEAAEQFLDGEAEALARRAVELALEGKRRRFAFASSASFRRAARGRSNSICPRCAAQPISPQRWPRSRRRPERV